MAATCVSCSARQLQAQLDAGADVNGRDILGASPLHYVCGCGEPQSGREYRLAQILLSHGANIEVKTVRGSTPLKIALVSGCRNQVLATRERVRRLQGATGRSRIVHCEL